MNTFKDINVNELGFTPFDIKDKNWMLVTAAKADGTVNTMTASWGGFGVMWNKNVVFVVIRPQRYTKEFVDNADSFSLTLFDNSYKKDLGYLGKVSGRDENKIEKVGFNILKNKEGIPFFKEAETAIFVKKLYIQPMGGEFFLDQKITETWFPQKDYHVLYIAEITQVLKKNHSALDDLDTVLL